jgi:hypothetical protein
VPYEPLPKFPIAPIFRALGGECGDYKSGKQKVLCPFHGDTRPSAQIDFVTQRFRCWACDVHGDGLDLLISQEGLTFRAAVERAEALTGGGGPQVREKPAEAPALFGRPRAGGRRS